MMVDYPHDSGRSQHYVSTLDFIISINNEVLPQNRKKYSLLLKKTKIDSVNGRKVEERRHKNISTQQPQFENLNDTVFLK